MVIFINPKCFQKSMRRMMDKRGQAAPAAVLLAIIMGLIIMFIMIIPPSERAKLLEEDSNGTGTSSTFSEEVLLDKNPGRLSFIQDKSFDKAMSSVHVYTEKEPSILSNNEYLNVKNALFSSQVKNVYFKIDDLENTENILLSFTIDSYRGTLIILLNDKEIFNKETHMVKPFKLSKSLLSENNTLTFKVSSPGVAFWRTNYYDLSMVKVVADVTDLSNQESKSILTISEDELKNMEKAILKFSTSCLSSSKGKLEVKINDYEVFNSVPECDDISYYTIPESKLKAGSNLISFKTEKGDYQIDTIALRVKLKDPSYPTYYFTIDDKYFTNATGDSSKLKDDYNVIMTLEFADDNKKEAEIYVNGYKISFDTYKIEFSHNIDNHVEPWTNSIKIIPKNSFDLKTLKVELKKD